MTLRLARERARFQDDNPARVYLATLSPGSHWAMTHALETIAALVSGGDADAETLPWWELRYRDAIAVRNLLAERYQPATVNKMLAALRGVLKQAWRLGLVDAETTGFLHGTTRTSGLSQTMALPPPLGAARSSADHADTVDIEHAVDELGGAVSEGRLVCPICFAPLKALYDWAGRSGFKNFAHPPRRDEFENCPNRSDSVTSQATLRALRRVLESKTLDQGLRESRSALEVMEDDEPAARIVYLDPDQLAELWALGQRDEPQLVFVTAPGDLERINRELLERLLGIQPIVVVAPASERRGERFGLLSDPSYLRCEVEEPLQWLDLMRVDWRLLGLDRRPSFVLIESAYKSRVRSLLMARREGLSSGDRKVASRLARRLLVDGAAVHRVVFGEDREEARRLVRAEEVLNSESELISLQELLTASRPSAITEYLVSSDREPFDKTYLELMNEMVAAVTAQIEKAETEVHELKQEVASSFLANRQLKANLREAEAVARELRSCLTQVDEWCGARERDLDTLAVGPVGRLVLWLRLRKRYRCGITDHPWRRSESAVQEVQERSNG